MLYHNPTLRCEQPVIWNYGYRWLDSIEFGKHVHVMPMCEIVVYKHARHSSKEGKLVVGDHSVLGTGVNIRAAGGRIMIGKNSGIGEYSIVLASAHAVYQGALYLSSEWDHSKSDVLIGDNVFIGAGCTLLPGSVVGDNSVVGAGSIVTGNIPANEIWAGAPAKKIRAVPTKEEFDAAARESATTHGG
ncbi:MAG: acyltransferase [bacterium]|nr:acyltransferase [bacterium]